MAWDQLLGFFSPEAGQARRQWLNRQEANVGNALRHYLGPAAQPIQSAAMLAGYMSPGADMMEAADASRGMWNADNPLDAAVAGATMLGATGMMFLPGNYNALREGIGSVADDMAAAYDPSRVNSIIAYHGSPHTFDRFDISKIGTGEGAQAYGHGLYFAENEDVARSYRDALSLDAGFSYGGQTGLTRDDVLARIEQDYGKSYLDNVTTPRGVADGVMDELIYGPSTRNYGPQRSALRDELRQVLSRTDPGSLYQVQINADPSQLLDWDAPLSAQPHIAERLGADAFANQRRAAEIRASVAEDMRLDGRSVPDLIDQQRLDLAAELELRDATGNASSFAPRSIEMARDLAARGIPGIQYLDAGSRAAGDGSRNFVIFDDSLIDILKRYGIGAAAAGGGWALAPEEAQAAGQVLDPQSRDRQQILDWLDSQGL